MGNNLYEEDKLEKELSENIDIHLEKIKLKLKLKF